VHGVYDIWVPLFGCDRVDSAVSALTVSVPGLLAIGTLLRCRLGAGYLGTILLSLCAVNCILFRL